MERHDHEWVALGNMEVCKVEHCSAYRATTEEADRVLQELGDHNRKPMKKTTDRKAQR